MNANFRGKGASPTNDFWHQKSRVPELSYGEKNAEKFNRLSRVHQRDRQQTDRQTDGRPIAYSERNVVRSLKMVQITLPNIYRSRLFTSKVIVWTRHTHTHRTDSFTRTTKMVGKCLDNYVPPFDPQSQDVTRCLPCISVLFYVA